MNLEYFALALVLILIWFTGRTVERAYIRSSRRWVSNSGLFAFSWVLCAALLTPDIFEYPEALLDTDFLYIVVVHLMFFGGLTMGLLTANRGGAVRQEPLQVRADALLIVFMIGILGQLIRGAEALASGELSLVDRLSLSNLSDVKSLYIGTSTAAPFGVAISLVAKIMSGVGQASLAIYAYIWVVHPTARQNRLIRNLALALLVLLVGNSWLITAGRFGIAMTVLFALLPFTLPQKLAVKPISRNTFRRIIIGLVAVAGILFFSIAFMDGRLAYSDPLVAMRGAHRATLAPWVLEATDGVRWARTLLLQVSYVTTTIPSLNYYLHFDNWGLPGMHWGAFNFEFLYNTLGRALPGYNSAESANAANTMYAPLINNGYFGGVWATMSRELMVDFGAYGSWVAYFVLGFASARATASYYRRPSPGVAVFLTSLRIVALFSGFHSVLPHVFFAFAFYAAVVFALVPGLIVSREKRPMAMQAEVNGAA